MQNKINCITKIRMLLGLTAITALCMAQSSASSNRSHGGGSGGGLPYPIASTVSQLIADINYANSVGGAITINLAPGATFDLKSANNTTDGGNGLPVIGGATAVALTIVGNGATIERIGVLTRYYTVKNPFRLFDVASGASLTLDHVTLKGGWSGSGGAILNYGTLNVINDCTLSGNQPGNGGAIYNAGGTVTVSDSTLSGNSGNLGGGIYNHGGTVTIGTSALSGNYAFSGGGIYTDGGTVAISNSTHSSNGARFGGGIYNNNAGAVTVRNSTLSNNSAWHGDYPWGGGNGGGIYNSGGTLTISSSTLSGNSADLNFGGGGIYNDVSGTVTLENYSSISGNTAGELDEDVQNSGVLHLDGTSTVGILDGNSATPL